MILETFTAEQIKSTLLSYQDTIETCVLSKIQDYVKAFKVRRKPTVFVRPIKYIIDRNKFISYIACPTDSPKDMICINFLVLETSKGRVYYEISPDCSVRRFSKHFIERFIERTSYNCTKENFLVYFCKEFLYAATYYTNPQDNVDYRKGQYGLAVIENNTYITYMSNLTKHKEEISLHSYASSLIKLREQFNSFRVEYYFKKSLIY